MIKKLFIIALTALSLGGCAKITSAIGIKNPVDNKSLSTIISTYGIADSAVIAYGQLPRCTTTNLPSATNWCYKRSVLVKAQALDKTANDQINKAVAWQRANPTLDASAYIDAAQGALDLLTSFNKDNGVQL